MEKASNTTGGSPIYYRSKAELSCTLISTVRVNFITSPHKAGCKEKQSSVPVPVPSLCEGEGLMTRRASNHKNYAQREKPIRKNKRTIKVKVNLI